MAKNMKLVRIRYIEVTDSYCLEISTDGGNEWEYSMGAQCQNAVGDCDGAVPMWVPCTLLEELRKCANRGFVLVE